MSKYHFAALVFGSFLFTGMVRAGTLVRFPTGNFAFTVDITYPPSPASATPTPAQSGAEATADRKPIRIAVAQYDGEKALRITWTDGQTTDQWTIPNLPVVFKIYPNGVIFPEGDGSMGHKLDTSGMPADPSVFSWVTASCLAEKDPVNYKGQLCYDYVGTVNLPRVQAGHRVREMVPVKREAWIESTTLLPVALNTGDSFCVYTFEPPPAGPLNMPENFQKAVANYKHVMGFP